MAALYTSNECAINDERKSEHGRFVIIELEDRASESLTLCQISPGVRQRRINTCEVRQKKILRSTYGSLLVPWESFRRPECAVNEVFDGFSPSSFVDRINGVQIKYQLFLPKDYHATGSYPLILFFHGGGEKGDDNFAPLLASQGGSIWAFPEVQEKHPSIVLVPQCPEDRDWIDPDTYELNECFHTVCRLLFSVLERYAVDRERIYCTGLSMGSMGVWEINKRYPHLFAASIMCVGQDNYEGIEILKDANLWAFHGENDDKAMPGVVDIMQTLENAGAIVDSDVWDGTLRGAAAQAQAIRQIARGADIMHTQFKEGTIKEDWVHVGGWKPVYSNPVVLEWLFSKRNEKFSAKSHSYRIKSFRQPVRTDLGFAGGELAEISCGARHNLALKKDGSVWSWGFNGSGQLGNGSLGLGAGPDVWPAKPEQVTGLCDIVQVAAGNNFSLALDKYGNVYGWGCNNCGQLGNPDMDQCFLQPVRILALCEIIEIGAGDSYGAALKADGTLWAWGSGCSGQLGQDSYFRSYLPLRVKNPQDPAGYLQNVRHFKTGIRSMFALTSDDRLYGWGDGEYGQLGNGTEGHGPGTRLPQLVMDAADAASEQTPGAGMGAVPERVPGDGTNAVAERVPGDGTNAISERAPGAGMNAVSERVPGTGMNAVLDGRLHDVEDVASGRCFTMVLKNDGSVYSFGLNRHGECAQCGVETSALPLRIDTLSAVRQIVAGMNHAAALKNDGTVWTWGYNKLMGDGVLGMPVADFTNIPVKVETLPEIERIYSGQNHIYALAMDGSIWAWGNGNDGRI